MLVSLLRLSLPALNQTYPTNPLNFLLVRCPVTNVIKRFSVGTTFFHWKSQWKFQLLNFQWKNVL